MKLMRMIINQHQPISSHSPPGSCPQAPSSVAELRQPRERQRDEGAVAAASAQLRGGERSVQPGIGGAGRLFLGGFHQMGGTNAIVHHISSYFITK